MADDRNLRAALAYATAGWRVFPCIPGEKVPATSHGVKDATTDPAQIRAWWARNPDRNVAIATGAPGPDVLDVDRHGDASGFPALRQLQSRRDRRPGGRAGPHPVRRRAPVRAGQRAGQRQPARPSHRLPQRRRLRGRPALARWAAAPTSWSATRATATRSTGPRSASTWSPSASASGSRPPVSATAGSKTWTIWWPRWRTSPRGTATGSCTGPPTGYSITARTSGCPSWLTPPWQRGWTGARPTGPSSPPGAAERQDPHATPQPRGPARLAPPRDPAPQPAARQEPAKRQEPQRGRAAVLEADRDGPQVAERPEPSRAQTREPAARTEHPAAAPAREPAREHKAPAELSEPAREDPGRPFAQADPGPEPEREAGE